MRSRLALAAFGMAQLTCHQVILTAPPGSTLALFANPQFIAAHGDVSVISALVTEPAGTPVPDGTVVQFFTNLGSIAEQGKTNDGVARVNLVSDSRSGTATVTAFSGGPATAPAPAPSASPGTGGGSTSGTTGSVQVVIGSALPARLQLTAFPVRIVSPARSSLIRAFVFDGNGNPVVNVPVAFTIEQPSGASPTEFMESRGGVAYSDNNGVAEDTLFTTYSPTAAAKTVTVRATPAGDASKSATVAVTIN